jgi:hypothetical protein
MIGSVPAHGHPVGDPQHPVGAGDHRRVVRGDQHRDSLGVRQRPHQLHDLLCVDGVELAGRLVGDQQPGPVGQRPRDRHPLLLAAGQLVGALVRMLPEPDHPQQQHRPLVPLGGVGAGEPHRDGDVLSGGEDRYQGVGLEDERQRLPAQPGQLIAAETGDFRPIYLHAAGVGPVQPANNVQQGGLSRAGPPDQRGQLARPRLQRRAAQRADRGRPAAERAGQLPHRDHRPRTGIHEASSSCAAAPELAGHTPM